MATPECKNKSFDEGYDDIEDLLVHQYLEPIRVENWKAVIKPKVKLIKGIRKTDFSLQEYQKLELPTPSKPSSVLQAWSTEIHTHAR